MTITVTDNEPPTLDCPDSPRAANTDPTASFATLTIEDAVVVDNSEVLYPFTAEITGAPTDSADTGVVKNTDPDNTVAGSAVKFPIGMTTVSYSATDTQGNVGTCEVEVGVTDNEDPVLVAPDDITLSTDAGLPHKTVEVPAPQEMHDNSGDAPTLVTTIPVDGVDTVVSGDVDFPIGSTVVTYTATDAAGGSTQVELTVTILDTELPVLVCPDDVTLNTDPGADGNPPGFAYATANVVGSQATVTDNSGEAPPITASIDGSLITTATTQFPIGQTTVVFVAVDANNNEGSCQMTVTVVDDEPPVLTCPPDVTVSTTANEDPALSGLPSATVILEDATVEDNSGEDLSFFGRSTDETEFQIGTHTVVFSATDPYEHTGTCTVTIVVLDQEDPVLTCPPDVPFDLAADGASFRDIDFTNDVGIATVVDNNVLVDTPVATATATILGSHETLDGTVRFYCCENSPTVVTFTATDVDGNTGSCTLTVSVQDIQIPQLTCPPDREDLTTDSVLPYKNYAFFPPAILDNSGETLIAVAVATSADRLADGDSLPVGIPYDAVDESYTANLYIGETQVTFTATDSSGLSGSCVTLFRVVDNEKPVFNCPALIQTYTEPGEAFTIVSVSKPGVTDNSGASITDAQSGLTAFLAYGSPDESEVSEDPDDSSKLGPMTLTIGYHNLMTLAVDATGNKKSCTITVQVIDNEPPVVTCPEDVTAPTNEAVNYAEVEIPSVDIADNSGAVDCDHSDVNCLTATITFLVDGDTRTLVAGSVTAFELDANTKSTQVYEITFSTEDAATNPGSCVWTLTVQDNEDPVVACPADIDRNTATDQPYALITLPALTMSDVTDNSAGSEYPEFHSSNTFTRINKLTGSSFAPYNFGLNPENLILTVDGLDQVIHLETSAATTSRSHAVAALSSDLAISGSSWTASVSDDGTSIELKTDSIVKIPWLVEIADASGVHAKALFGDATASIEGLFFIGQPCAPDCEAGETDIPANAVVYSAKDSSGNEGECTMAIAVTDDQSPAVACPFDITEQTQTHEPYMEITLTIIDTVVDNSQETLIAEPSVFVCAETAAESVPYDFAACSEVTALEEAAACEAVMTHADEGIRACTYGHISSAGVPMDGVPKPLVSANPNLQEPHRFYIGTTTVTYTATDSSLQVGTCIQTVVVQDVEAPRLTCPTHVVVGPNPSSTTEEPIGAVPTDLYKDYATVTIDGPNDVTTVDNADEVTTAQLGLSVQVTAVDKNGIDLDVPGGTFEFPIGVTPLTFYVVDGANNRGECVSNILVLDVEAPTLSCPSAADYASGTTPGEAYATFTIVGTDADVYDNNGADSTAENIANGIMAPEATYVDTSIAGSGSSGAVVAEDCSTGTHEFDVDKCIRVISASTVVNLPIGITAITFRAKDSHNNVGYCVVEALISDTEDPVLTCPSDLTYTSNPTFSYAAVDVGDVAAFTVYPTVTDNAGEDLSVTVKPTIADVGEITGSYNFPIGVTEVIFEATDSADNVGNCVITVTVTDDEAPVLVCEPSAVEQETDPAVVESCTADTGTDPATCTFTPGDAGSCPAGCTHVAAASPPIGFEYATVSLTAPSVTDNSGATLVAVPDTIDGAMISQFSMGLTTVTFTAYDGAGDPDSDNAGTCVVTVTVNDIEDPHLVCPPSENLTTDDLQPYATFTLNAGVAADNSLEVLGEGITTDVTLTEYPIGTTTVTYSATDASGNTGQCQMTVTVTDEEDPRLECPDLIEQVTDPLVAFASVVLGDPTIVDNSGETLVGTPKLDAGDVISTDPQDLPHFEIGQTSVTYFATDAAGNIGQCTYIVRILDNQLPELTCPDDHVVTTDPPLYAAPFGRAYATITLLAAEVQDNSGLVLVATATVGGTGSAPTSCVFPFKHWGIEYTECINISEGGEGTYDYAWCATAVDSDGNYEVGSGNSVQCPDFIPRTVVGPNEGEGLPDDLINMDWPEFRYDGGDGNGVFMVTYTAIDDENNIGTCDIMVTVTDDEKPVLTCPPPQSVKTDHQQTYATVSLADTVVADNSGEVLTAAANIRDQDGSEIPVVIGEAFQFQWLGTAPKGVEYIDVNYTATDRSLNSGFCTITITVSEMDDCSPNPCEHGNCTDLIADFSCACDAGWQGTTCAQDIDECATLTPCQNGAECRDSTDLNPDGSKMGCESDGGWTSTDPDCIPIDQYQCICPLHGDESESRFSGHDCEILDECSSLYDPCHNVDTFFTKLGPGEGEVTNPGHFFCTAADILKSFEGESFDRFLCVDPDKTTTGDFYCRCPTCQETIFQEEMAGILTSYLEVHPSMQLYIKGEVRKQQQTGGECVDPSIPAPGCTDPTARNYDPLANEDDDRSVAVVPP
jgi:hypothetical protein